ncbi:MAG: DUF4097 family beta strand repeat-containing protein [Rudaea sp.]
MRTILALLLLLSSSLASADNCKFSAERNLDIDPAGLHALRVELGSSDLHLQGVADLKRIEVRGKACASEQAWLADLNVTQSREGDKIVIKPVKSPERHGALLGNSYAYIDLVVRIPAALALEVDSGSGDAEIANIAALDFTAGSGDLKLEHVAGAVVVEVHSGDVVASDVASFTLRKTGSGDVHANNLRGEVKVGHAGSGDLHFADVHGGVQIDSIGSGDLGVERIGGDVVLGSIGSGDVEANHVTGNLIVKAAGSGEIHREQIGGRVEVPKNRAAD